MEPVVALAEETTALKALGNLDYAFIGLYIVVMLVFGLYLARRASGSLEDYYLGGRTLPWYLLGTSGMQMWFDLTGTMVICSFLYMMGPRGMFVEFRGGVGLVLAFAMCFTGKWHRRSGCITGAEWNIFRFGKGADAECARVLTAIMGLVGTVGMLAYLVRGTGLFLATFLPFSPTQCAVAMLLVAGLYTMASGFYGVVFTDVIQAVIVVFASVFISYLAFRSAPDVPELTALAERVTGVSNWTSSAPRPHVDLPAGYEAYQSLIMVMIFYWFRNVLGGLGTGAEPRLFGARNDREAGMQSLLMGALMAFRWPMMLAFAVLGLLVVVRLFPDTATVGQVAELIRGYHPGIAEGAWHDLISSISLRPDLQDPALIEGLRSILGANWTEKLAFVSYSGIINPERILPAVILDSIPLGVRGLVIVAMIAATMSTFDSFVNMGSALFVRDIYQRWIRPVAGTRELMVASYVTVATVVVIGLIMGSGAKSINDIWGWLVMSLMAGALAPSLLRLYWWRFNGWGVAAGTAFGGAAAVIQRAVFPDLPELQQFVIVGFISFASSIGVSLLTRPTAKATLDHFYRTTRPFGFWGPVRASLSGNEQKLVDKENFYDMVSVPFAMLAQVTLYLLPMQLILGTYRAFGITLGIFLVGAVGTYFLWYKRLPAANADGLETADSAAAANQ